MVNLLPSALISLNDFHRSNQFVVPYLPYLLLFTKKRLYNDLDFHNHLFLGEQRAEKLGQVQV